MYPILCHLLGRQNCRGRPCKIQHWEDKGWLKASYLLKWTTPRVKGLDSCNVQFVYNEKCFWLKILEDSSNLMPVLLEYSLLDYCKEKGRLWPSWCTRPWCDLDRKNYFTLGTVWHGLGGLPAEGGAAAAQDGGDAGAEHQGNHSSTGYPEPEHKLTGSEHLEGGLVAELDVLDTLAVHGAVLVFIHVIHFVHDSFVIIKTNSILDRVSSLGKSISKFSESVPLD